MAERDDIISGEVTIDGANYRMESIHYGSGWEKIWPRSFVFKLRPIITSYGGNYTTNNFPASGGVVYLSWAVDVYRDQETEVFETLTENIVPTFISLDNGSGFYYGNNYTYIAAYDRGCNGRTPNQYSYYTPQNADQRTCTLTNASAQITYNGEVVTAEYDTSVVLSITQLRNYYRYDTNYDYTDVQISLANNEIGAHGGSIAIDSVYALYRQKVYFDSNSSYTFVQDIADKYRFSYSSSASWAPVDTSTYSVTVYSRGYDEGPDRDARIYASINGYSDYSTITQLQNYRHIRSEEREDIRSIELDDFQVPLAGGEIIIPAHIVEGTFYAAVYYWDSLEPDTGGGSTSLNGQDVALNKIQVNGVTYDGTNSFTAPSHIHIEESTQYSCFGWYGGKKNSTAKVVIQAADYKDTDYSTWNWTATVSIPDGMLQAYSTETNLSVNVGHYERTIITWHSDSAIVSDTGDVWAPDPYSLIMTILSGNSQRFHLNTEDTSLPFSHDSMAKNQETDSVRFTITNQTRTSITNYIERSVTNSRGDFTFISDSPNTRAGTPYTGYNYSDSDYYINLSQFNSESDPAPAGGGTYSILSYGAKHQERTVTPYTIEHNYLYRAFYSSHTTDNPVYDEKTESFSGEGIPSYGAWSDIQETTGTGGTLSFTYQSPVTGISGTNVTIGNNTGNSRNGLITMRVRRLDDVGGYITKEVRLYQQKDCDIYASDGDLSFSADGENKVLRITYKNTRFTVSFTTPVSEITPPGPYGQIIGTGYVDLTIKVPATTSSSEVQGVITITPEESVLSVIEVAAIQSGAVVGNLLGYVDAMWTSNNTVTYNWELVNRYGTSRTLSPIIYFYTTSREDRDPDHDPLSMYIGQVDLSPVTVPGNDSVLGNNIVTMNKVDGVYYWAKITGIDVTSSWTPFEEEDTPE